MDDKTHNVSEGGSYIVEKPGDKPVLVSRTQERAADASDAPVAEAADETADTPEKAASTSSKPSKTTKG